MSDIMDRVASAFGASETCSNQYTSPCWPLVVVGMLCVLVINAILSLRYAFKEASPTPPKGDPADKIVLYGFHKPEGSICLSQYVSKVETFLKMAGLPYEFQSGVPDGAPKRKVNIIASVALMQLQLPVAATLHRSLCSTCGPATATTDTPLILDSSIRLPCLHPHCGCHGYADALDTTRSKHC